MGILFTFLKKTDWLIVAIIFLLVILGLVTIYSIGKNNEIPSTSSFYRQLISAIIGFVLFVACLFVSTRFLKSYAFIFYLFGLLLLIIVLFFGTEIGGTKGWLSIAGFTIQPIEISRICFILFLAQFFSRKSTELDKAKNIIISGLIVLPYIILVLLQPDLGSAVILVLIWLLIIFMSRVRKKYLIIILISFVLIAIISWFFILQDYQKNRITAFLDPQSDPLGQGYNVSQSIIAIGSGGLLGRGLGLGPQSQLNFLPTQETDFIFSVIAEELGFLGAGMVLVLFALLFWRLLKILKKQQDEFNQYLLLSILVLIFFQFLVNIGMNLGLLPVTGLPLPFISLAGTSLIVNFALFGFVQGMHIRKIH